MARKRILARGSAWLALALCALMAASGCSGGAAGARPGLGGGQAASAGGGGPTEGLAATASPSPGDGGGTGANGAGGVDGTRGEGGNGDRGRDVETGLPDADGAQQGGSAYALAQQTAPYGGSGADIGAAADAGAGAALPPHSFADVDNSGDIIEIKEKMFIAQTNDIYLNASEYMGKTIRYEGFFTQYDDPDTGETYSFVIRNGPGCCPGVDNSAGFEVAWGAQWPNADDWVEVSGKLETYEDYSGEYIRLNLDSLSVLDMRGADFVTQ
jgi:hypothetical protein